MATISKPGKLTPADNLKLLVLLHTYIQEIDLATAKSTDQRKAAEELLPLVETIWGKASLLVRRRAKKGRGEFAFAPWNGEVKPQDGVRGADSFFSQLSTKSKKLPEVNGNPLSCDDKFLAYLFGLHSSLN